MRAVRRPDVHLSIVPRYFELFTSNATLEELEGMPVVTLPPMRLSRSAAPLKRAFDLVVAAAALLVLVAAARWSSRSPIKLDSRGPGALPPGPPRPRRRATFQIVKFRTMVDGAEGQRRALAGAERDRAAPLFKIKRATRASRASARSCAH